MLGIDVSNNNGALDWTKIAAGGTKFAYAKATQGTWFLDQFFDSNRKSAKAAGIAIGAYHYAEPGIGDPMAEASWFCDTVRSVRADELRPVLDLETIVPSGWTPTQYAAWAGKWLAEVERRLDVRPVIYTYLSYYRDALLEPDPATGGLRPAAPVGDYPLWLAFYGANDGAYHAAPTVNGGVRVVAQQYTSQGSTSGFSGDLNECADLNLLREHGDYLLWRDWRAAGALGSKRPAGLPARIARPDSRTRWLDSELSDSAAISVRIAAATDPLRAQLADVQARLDAASLQLANDHFTEERLVAERDALQSRLTKIKEAVANA